jgi:hypothetical protein
MIDQETLKIYFKILDYLIEILKIIVWPALILSILFTLKKEIVNLINRIKTWGFKDNKIEFYNQTKQDGINDTTQVDNFLGQFSSGSEEFLTKKYQSIVHDESLESVKRHFKASLLIGEFNFLYYNIFGSQLNILLILEKSSLETYTSLRRFYEEARINYAITFPAFYPYEQYIDFLTSRGLISINSDSANLTNFGKDFLKYLRTNGYVMIKIN